MGAAPVLFVAALIVALCGLAGYFAVRQVAVLRQLPRSQEPLEDRRYARNQAWRRLFGCLLMVIIAVLLLGWFAFGVDDRARELLQEGKVAAEQGAPRMSPEQRQRLYAITLYVIFLLVVSCALVLTAALDFWAIRVYGLRQRRKLQEDRRAMLARQAARLRTEQNGHH